MTTACDVLVVGAGPVGLTLANLLGQHGVRVLVAEREQQLIDYPRAVGIDDEALRAMQTAGLVEGCSRTPSPTRRSTWSTGTD
ncbi:FAD-dependent monooxygenase [Streptacidiphilus monticola]